jgi:phosphopentomutase
VIARPFIGEPGAWKRTYNRRDFALPPPEPTVLSRIADAGLPVVGVGKIWDIFAGHGVTQNIHTEGNTDGLAHTLKPWIRLRRAWCFATWSTSTCCTDTAAIPLATRAR